VVERIDRGALPVLSWAPELEEGAVQQAVNCANLPVTHHHVAVMADGHQGYGVPIGAVLPLKDAISPYAVGNDIGCGMALLPTTVSRDDFASRRDEVMGWIQTSIPSGNATNGRGGDANPEVDPLLHDAYEAMEEAAGLLREPLSTSQTPDAAKGGALEREQFVTRGRSHVGTLGSGNHFIEVLADPEDRVWLMLHSGSRGVGSLVCNNFHRWALRHCREAGHQLPDPGLAWLPIGDGDERWERVGRCYSRAQKAALAYAGQNRQRMLTTASDELERRFPGSIRWDELVNIHHNDATLEEHYGAEVWVHRKGAVKAAPGTATITPGSMGTGSYLGRGRGNPEAFSSCSHGAGRVMSRGQARKTLSLQAELESIRSAGGKVFAASKEAVLDEMPSAYKDLDEVMANQADLVETVLRLTPLGTYKGADPPRRRKGKGGGGKWRPEEER
jgi:tRNA-splicing ligase RtcB (3'-phosphate/5'-hydroxy nucleic acid ligase)